MHCWAPWVHTINTCSLKESEWLSILCHQQLVLLAGAAAPSLPPAAQFILSNNRGFRSAELPNAADGRRMVIKKVIKKMGVTTVAFKSQ